MKADILVMIFLVFVGILMITPSASAQQSVTINGVTWTCTNQCHVTVTSSGYQIMDCCGGRVSVSFTPPPAEP